MGNFADFDPNAASNPTNNIYGFPITEEEARVVILPVPWEVTVSNTAGTARAVEHIFRASMQVDVYDTDYPDIWKNGYYLRPADKKILLKSDYLRKEAELYIDYISRGEELKKNAFMCKSLKDINAGGTYLNEWVYEQTKSLMNRGKLVALLGGDHSTPLGYFKAIAEKHGEFGILQIDAHPDLRECYEDFDYSHASIMYNALKEIPQIQKLVQLGIRDYSQEEFNYISNSNGRIVTFFDKHIKERQYEGETWKQITDDIINQLPQKIFLSFDIDGLDPKHAPNTGTPVYGGFDPEHIYYLLKKMNAAGKQLIGFDLVEVGVGDGCWDANVGARVLLKLCNILTAANS
ncbi:MAG: agmatinase family protein [Chitinophagaceae bacterium]|nr:agmatinase family protein [Chitinophagaceae bacterium]